MPLKIESKIIYRSSDNTILIEVDESNKIEVKPYNVNHGSLLELAEACRKAHALIETRVNKSEAVQ